MHRPLAIGQFLYFSHQKVSTRTDSKNYFSIKSSILTFQVLRSVLVREYVFIYGCQKHNTNFMTTGEAWH